MKIIISKDNGLETMTVGQLKKLLESYDDECPIMFSYNYGDRVRTRVAQDIKQIDWEDVEWSSYHNSWRIVDYSTWFAKDEDEFIPEVSEMLIIS